MTMIGNNDEILYKKKSMKIIKMIIVMLVLLFLVTIGIVIAIYYEHQKEFKVVIDGVETRDISSNAFIVDGEKVYISIKDIAPYLGEYKYNNGEYKKYSEDKTSCYVQNSNEVANYALNSRTLYKTITSDSSEIEIDQDNINYETYTLDEPVILSNNKLYTTMQGISLGCNVAIKYDVDSNTLSIVTLPSIVASFTNSFPESDISGEDAAFSNKKAALYNLIVVKDSKNNYGVVNSKGEAVIGKKYKSVQFVENEEEFIVKTEEDKMGIISKDGTTKIKPEYQSIKEIYKKNGLYLVSNDSKYGVVNKNGKTIIFNEFDRIGIKTENFPNDEIRNGYILYDNCIPVEKNGKFGMFDINGNLLLDVKYDELGCTEGKSDDRVANSLLLVPDYEGIVVKFNKQYGLVNSSGKELIPALVTDMYSITSSGVSTYYLTYNNQTMNIVDYLKNTLKIPPVNKTTKQETGEQAENVVTTDNEITSSATTTENK